MDKLEGPQLSLKIMKSSPVSALKRLIREDDFAVSLYPKDGEMLPIPTCSWAAVDSCKQAAEDLQTWPDAYCNLVLLNEVLEIGDLEWGRKLIKECKRITKNGGMVIAMSKACHHGEELYDLVRKTSLDMTKFVERRLSNQRIANLKPNEAMFFNDMLAVPSRRRLHKLMKDMGIEADLERMWGFPEKLAVNLFYVCMKWTVQR